MRMWMLPPHILCRQHLLGEHSELHKFMPGWLKRRSLTGYIKSNAVEPASYELRHAELAAEMTRRGYNHISPLFQPDFSYLPREEFNAKVDTQESLRILLERCPECRKRYEEESRCT